MRDVVRTKFPTWSIHLEGYCPYGYADDENLVTMGIGDLIDAGPRNSTACTPVAMAPTFEIPWKHKANLALATRDEVAAAWIKIKSAGWGARGGGAYALLTDLIVTADDIAAIVAKRMDIDDVDTAKVYGTYQAWPGVGQFAIMSMDWALGPEFAPTWPKFHAALMQPIPDFITAAAECKISNGAPARNAANKAMFLAAADIQANGGDYDDLSAVPN